MYYIYKHSITGEYHIVDTFVLNCAKVFWYCGYKHSWVAAHNYVVWHNILNMLDDFNTTLELCNPELSYCVIKNHEGNLSVRFYIAYADDAPHLTYIIPAAYTDGNILIDSTDFMPTLDDHSALYINNTIKKLEKVFNSNGEYAYVSPQELRKKEIQQFISKDCNTVHEIKVKELL